MNITANVVTPPATSVGPVKLTDTSPTGCGATVVNELAEVAVTVSELVDTDTVYMPGRGGVVTCVKSARSVSPGATTVLPTIPSLNEGLPLHPPATTVLCVVTS